jgi:hypothetical protein
MEGHYFLPPKTPLQLPTSYLGLYTTILIFSFKKWQEKKHLQNHLFKSFLELKKKFLQVVKIHPK